MPEDNSGQLVLDTETKQLTTRSGPAAFNTLTTQAADLRTDIGYARANDEAHSLIRQLLTQTGDINPTVRGQLTIRLETLPTRRATIAAQLCAHSTATRTRYHGTGLILCYEIKQPA